MRTNETPSPLIKWAGGKRQLLDRIDSRLPAKYGHYYEPFCGGGALYFHLQPKEATINDLNQALINLYERVRDEHDDFVRTLSEIDAAIPHDKAESKAYYLKRTTTICAADITNFSPLVLIPLRQRPSWFSSTNTVLMAYTALTLKARLMCHTTTH